MIAPFGISGGEQFELASFKSLAQLLDVDKRRATPYLLQSNWFIKQFYKPLKVHKATHWIKVLPTVILGFRVALKESIITCIWTNPSLAR